MADTTFSYFQRRALWEAHNKRCSYCQAPLSYRDVEIDHIVPESLPNDAGAWAQAQKDIPLPDGFNVNGYENLTPSCTTCNSRKHGQALAYGRIAIELTNAGRLKPMVEELVERFKRYDKADKQKFAIAAAVESGTLSAKDIAKIVLDAHANMGRFKLSRPLATFLESEPLAELSRSDYERYLDMKVDAEGLDLTNDNEEKVKVTTLREYKNAVARGYFAYSNLDNQVAHGLFETPLILLDILKTTKVSEVSFVDDPYCGLADIALIPASILFLTEDMSTDPHDSKERAQLEGRMLGDLVSDRVAVVTSVGSGLLRVEYDDAITYMLEMMRGDFNGDGIQEILIHWGAGPIHGTYRAASFLLLTRKSATDPFSFERLGATGHGPAASKPTP